MRRHHARIVCLLIIAATAAASSPLRGYDCYGDERSGELKRWNRLTQRYETTDYPSEDQKYLGRMANAVNEGASTTQIWFLPNTSCGSCATTCVQVTAPVLPDGAEVFLVNSVDPFNLAGGTAHTQYAVKLPSGNVYVCDLYLSHEVQITKMKEVVTGSGENDRVYLPAEAPKSNSWGGGYLAIMDNPEYCFKKADSSRYNPSYDKFLKDRAKQQLKEIKMRKSYDPNDLSGPGGAGAARCVQGRARMDYLVSFENMATASLPAATVVVTNRIDPQVFDLDSFALSGIDFGGTRLEVPSDELQAHSATVDLRPAQNLLVKVEAALDEASSTATWTFTTLDPDTLLPPEDPTVGFLPPNKNPPEGEGHMRYSVKLREGLAAGTTASSKAGIVFDANAAIETPTWTNTVDCEPPACRVEALPATQRTTAFTVSWSGEDGYSGVASYSLYYSTDGAAYTAWPHAPSATSTTFAGEKGKTYYFHCVAIDGVGNASAIPAAPDASTTIAEDADSAMVSLSAVTLDSYTEQSPGVWVCGYMVSAVNTGSLPVSSLTATMLQAPPGFTIVNATASLGDLAAGASATSAASIVARVDVSKADAASSALLNLGFSAGGVAHAGAYVVELTLPDVVAPALRITSPCAEGGWETNDGIVHLAGELRPRSRLVAFSWSNAATGESGAVEPGYRWYSPVPLADGLNGITVTAVDAGGNSSSTSITVTRRLFSLTVNDGNGGGQYHYGAEVPIAANDAPSGKVFNAWTGIFVAEPSSPTTTLTMPASDASVSATYRLSGGRACLLDVVNGSGDGIYERGTTIWVAADTPQEGQEFNAWTGAVVAAPSTASTSLAMPARNTTLTATYRPAGSQTFALNVVNGSGEGSYAADTTVTISADPPPDGQAFIGWSVDIPANVALAGQSAPETVAVVKGAATVTATYGTSTPMTSIAFTQIYSEKVNATKTGAVAMWRASFSAKTAAAPPKFDDDTVMGVRMGDFDSAAYFSTIADLKAIAAEDKRRASVTANSARGTGRVCYRLDGKCGTISFTWNPKGMKAAVSLSHDGSKAAAEPATPMAIDAPAGAVKAVLDSVIISGGTSAAGSTNCAGVVKKSAKGSLELRSYRVRN